MKNNIEESIVKKIKNKRLKVFILKISIFY